MQMKTPRGLSKCTLNFILSKLVCKVLYMQYLEVYLKQGLIQKLLNGMPENIWITVHSKTIKYVIKNLIKIFSCVLSQV